LKITPSSDFSNEPLEALVISGPLAGIGTSPSSLKRHGFSLVELSIVLVILGLLTGGILAGKSLIRASELRAATTEYNRYLTAIRSFQDKYFAMPGDITNATSFWGKDATSAVACASQPGTAATPGTCNGNGDGQVAVNQIDEPYRVWQHLAMSGLIEGSYTGYINPDNFYGTPATVGGNIPASKLTPAGWFLLWATQASSGSVLLGFSDGPSVFNNYLVIGGVSANIPRDAVFVPEEAWNIDSKLDDGLPASGMVRTGTGISNCTTNSTISSAYALSYTTKNCILGFRVN
jgi:prepilin-type N-terminal cleavage/methylation domain-containing protein